MDTNEIATPDSWKHQPITMPKRVEAELHYTASQYEQLIQGYIPEVMEDRWFIYFDEGFLHFHRSWTGFGIYKARLTKENNAYTIREFWVEQNPENYHAADDAYECASMASLISGRLLDTPRF
ncbi:MAG: hypothetical protein ACT6QS_12370 [Flavobacteriales bacterium]